MLRTTILTLVLCSLFQLSQAQNINASKSRVSFEISNLAFNTVEGSFSGISGKIYLNEFALKKSLLKVCLDPATVNTGIEKRDDHLRSEDFFWVDKYPQICFYGREFEFLGEGRWLVTGKLKIRDIKREVQVELLQQDDKISCEFEINRLDYEVGLDISSFTAGEEVKLEVKLYTR